MEALDTFATPLILLFTRSSSYLHFFKQTLSHDYDLVEATSTASCLDMLANLKIQFLVLDEKMVQDDIEAFLGRVKQKEEYRHLPILLITRNLKKSFLRSMQEMGIVDLIREPLDQELILSQFAKHSPKTVIENKVRALSSRIPKSAENTSLAFKHRFLLNDKVHKKIDEILKEKQSLSLLMLELDDYNDTVEHLTKTSNITILEKFDAKIEALMRPQDVMISLGGGKYMILLPKTSKNVAHSLAEELQIAIELTGIRVEEEMIHFSASIGIASRNIEEQEEPSKSIRELGRLINIATSFAIESKHLGGEVVGEA